MTITLTEGFDSTSGEFNDYDAYQTADLVNIKSLKHRDIRVMQHADLTAGQIEGAAANRLGEAWSGGTVAIDATRGGVRILSMTLAVGLNTASSVMARPVDLLTDFADTDHISIALPTFPAGSVTQATSFIDFTSHPTGNFTTGPTASVALSASLVTLTAANSEFRVLRSAFVQNGIDLSAITGVRLRIQATGVNTLRVMAIRLLASDWTFGSVDYDTRYQRLVKAIPRNGDMTATRWTQPILWRSQAPSNPLDPKPIDAEIAVSFNSGALASPNSLSLYFREVTEDFMTMLDLNGLSMAELNGHVMPNVGTARYSSRTMADLAQFTHDQLYGETMFSLERKADYLSASWINFTLTWASASASIQMGNTESGNSGATGLYNLPLAAPLTANTQYVWFATMEENSVRSRLYTLLSDGSVGVLVYDSTTIIDDASFRRRKGRFGWYADLQDGTAYVDSIRARKVSYAEYRSLPFRSITPVEGAELFFAGSDNIEHYTGIERPPANNVGTLINADSGRTTTGSSWRVDNLAAVSNQGIQTNSFPLEDFEDTEVAFDLWYTADPVAYPILPYLVSESGRTIPMYMPKIVPHQWQHISLKLPFGTSMLSGSYRFQLLQTVAAPLSWWIDGITIFSRSLTWEGRAVTDDPWGSNVATWVPFKNAINKTEAGALFATRGKELQVRAKAATPSGYIDRVQFKPRYAQLGRFKPKGVVLNTTAPTVSFGNVAEGGLVLRLTSTSGPAQVGSPASTIVNNEWNFGDGTSGIGDIVRHTYPAAGTYTVTLISTDNRGNRGVTSGTVTV